MLPIMSDSQVSDQAENTPYQPRSPRADSLVLESQIAKRHSSIARSAEPTHTGGRTPNWIKSRFGQALATASDIVVATVDAVAEAGSLEAIDPALKADFKWATELSARYGLDNTVTTYHVSVDAVTVLRAVALAVKARHGKDEAAEVLRLVDRIVKSGQGIDGSIDVSVTQTSAASHDAGADELE